VKPPVAFWSDTAFKEFGNEEVTSYIAAKGLGRNDNSTGSAACRIDPGNLAQHYSSIWAAPVRI
jgi:hypothetical protein